MNNEPEDTGTDSSHSDDNFKSLQKDSNLHLSNVLNKLEDDGPAGNSPLGRTAGLNTGSHEEQKQPTQAKDQDRMKVDLPVEITDTEEPSLPRERSLSWLYFGMLGIIIFQLLIVSRINQFDLLIATLAKSHSALESPSLENQSTQPLRTTPANNFESRIEVLERDLGAQALLLEHIQQSFFRQARVDQNGAKKVETKAEPKALATGWFVNVATFAQLNSARRLNEKLVDLELESRIATFESDSVSLYRVRITNLESREQAANLAQRLSSDLQLSGLWVDKITEQP